MPIVASYNKPEEAYLAASLLEGNDIECEVLDAETVSMDWMYSQAVGGVKLTVAEEDLEAAREVLSLPKLETEILACPHCGSSNTHLRELSLISALSLLLSPVFLPIKSRTADCLDCKQSCEYKPEPQARRKASKASQTG